MHTRFEIVSNIIMILKSGCAAPPKTVFRPTKNFQTFLLWACWMKPTKKEKYVASPSFGTLIKFVGGTEE